MTHRVEQVMERVKTLLTGLPTTGANIKRTRRYALPTGVQHGLFLSQGADENLPEETPVLVRSQLDVQVDAVVAVTDEEVEPILNQIRTEVNDQLAADVQLGLPTIVTKCWEIGAGEPAIPDEGSPGTARMRLLWRVQYRRNIRDPEN